jgi:hypothetical protein
LAIEKQDCPERLILRALCHAAVDGQVGQKRFHFPLPHLLRMTPSTCAIMVVLAFVFHPPEVIMDGGELFVTVDLQAGAVATRE